MHVGFEVEQFRQKYGLSVLAVRIPLDMTDTEYRKFINGKYTPAAYQLVWFLTAFRCPLDSAIGKKFAAGMPTHPYKQI